MGTNTRRFFWATVLFALSRNRAPLCSGFIFLSYLSHHDLEHMSNGSCSAFASSMGRRT